MTKESCGPSVFPTFIRIVWWIFASFTRIPPMVNQIETHVLNQRIEDHAWMEKYHIAHEAWRLSARAAEVFDNEILKQIGEKYGKTAAQVMLAGTSREA